MTNTSQPIPATTVAASLEEIELIDSNQRCTGLKTYRYSGYSIKAKIDLHQLYDP